MADDFAGVRQMPRCGHITDGIIVDDPANLPPAHRRVTGDQNKGRREDDTQEVGQNVSHPESLVAIGNDLTHSRLATANSETPRLMRRRFRIMFASPANARSSRALTPGTMRKSVSANSAISAAPLL